MVLTLLALAANLFLSLTSRGRLRHGDLEFCYDEIWSALNGKERRRLVVLL
jgi:hypothetical protein